MCVSGGGRGAPFPTRRPLYYLVTDRKQLASGALLRRVRRLLRWGIDFIQVREKDLDDCDLLRLASKIVQLARGTRCRVLVNGRADVALAAGAHGVHLPSTGLGVADVRAWVPPRFLIGCSTHSGAEARKAQAEGADYVLLGPVFATPSKSHLGSPIGLAAFAEICRGLDVPVIGLGGISRETVPAVLEAGASGIAAIRLFQSEGGFPSRLPRVLGPAPSSKGRQDPAAPAVIRDAAGHRKGRRGRPGKRDLILPARSLPRKRRLK